jgi:hypothetical protein
MKELPDMTIQGAAPRMIDFALWSMAAWAAMGWDMLFGDFMGMYSENRRIASNQGLESDPFALAIIQLVEERGDWTGTPAQALDVLSNYTSYQDRQSRAWPAPNKFRNRVRRIAPVLRANGIEFQDLPRKAHERKIAFKRMEMEG